MTRLDDLQSRFDAVESALNDRLPGPLKVGFLTLYVYTERGEPWVDAVADRGPWKRWHDIGVLALLATGLASLLAVAWVAVAAATGSVESTAANDPGNMVAVPGLNDFMPLAAAGYIVLALLVATLAHEGGHAVATRLDDVPIEEMGVALLFGVIPLAAYVLPGDALDDAPARTRLRVFAAGVANNLALTVLAVVGFLLVGPALAVDAYMTYFGWLYTSAAAPTAAAVASIGVVGNLLFWTGFLNANLALLNALPVWPLDGGKVLKIVVDSTASRLGVGGSRHVLVGAGALTASAVVLALFGPLLF
ncbi:site-2 protease family protein [Haloarchaeobius sp. DYHT-AS-18]|uniref:site-2 protease family protein n=1 Tax=Haloarchaeobius sp. DYHT-AS-18 TaxID=3446117 RepID=UPI003EBE3F33